MHGTHHVSIQATSDKLRESRELHVDCQDLVALLNAEYPRLSSSLLSGDWK